jgi:hypothetical protein
MRGAIPRLPQYAFMVLCSVKAQGQLYLYLYVESYALTQSVQKGICTLQGNVPIRSRTSPSRDALYIHLVF